MLDRRERILDHELNIQVCPDLVEDYAEVIRLRVGEHDKLQSRGRFVVVELVFASPEGEKAVDTRSCQRQAAIKLLQGHAYVSSSPPSCLTIFLKEKMAPNMSFASSSLDRALRPTWPSPSLMRLPPDVGRPAFVLAADGRIHRLL